MATISAFPSPDLRFEVETEAIVYCTGRLTSSTAELLRTMIKPLMAENDSVVLEMSRVDHIDSSGLGTLVGLYVSARAADCQLRLVNVNQRVKELLKITRLFDVLVKER